VRIDSHSSVTEDNSLQACDTVPLGVHSQFLMFLRFLTAWPWR